MNSNGVIIGSCTVWIATFKEDGDFIGPYIYITKGRFEIKEKI